MKPLTDISTRKKRFLGGCYWPKLIWEERLKSFNISLFEMTSFRIWLYISKFENNKTAFCLILFGNFLKLDTSFLGKKIFGRLNLTALFGRDYSIIGQAMSNLTSEK